MKDLLILILAASLGGTLLLLRVEQKRNAPPRAATAPAARPEVLTDSPRLPPANDPAASSPRNEPLESSPVLAQSRKTIQEARRLYSTALSEDDVDRRRALLEEARGTASGAQRQLESLESTPEVLEARQRARQLSTDIVRALPF